MGAVKFLNAVTLRHRFTAPVIYARESIRRSSTVAEKPKGTLKFDLKFAVEKHDINEHYSQQAAVRMKVIAKERKEEVFVFPGFEGRLVSVAPFVEQVDQTVCCLEYPLEKSPMHLDELVDLSTTLINERLDTNSVNIFTHSFGGLIAFKVVDRLESEGKDVRLCISDFSPYAIKTMAAASFGHISRSNEFENNLIENVLGKFPLLNVAEIIECLKNIKDWDTKIQILLTKLPDETSEDKQRVAVVLNNIYNRIYSIQSYEELCRKLKSKARLIKSPIKVLPYPEDFQIQKYFEKPVEVYYAEGHHLNMLKYKRTVDLIMDTFKLD